MEKLIELLNERIKEWWKPYWDDYSITKIDEIWKSDWLYFVSFVWEDYPWPVNLEHLLTKQAGLIKWLVENDKINLDDQAMQYAKSDLSKFFTEWKDKNWMSDDYAMLLMLLSIQDEPIRFLCEIIK